MTGLAKATLVLVADRAASPAERDPGLGAARYGALSFPVSFVALRAWTARRGGASLRPRTARHVHVAGFIVGGERPRWPATRAAWTLVMRDGPDARYAARRRLPATASLTTLLGLIDRCGPDPRVIAECLRPLWPHLDGASAAVCRRLRDAVLAAWPNYFHLGEPYDLPFDLAVLLYQVGAYAEATRLFDASRRLHGDAAATSSNLGLCHVTLRKTAAAEAAFRRARRLAPGWRAAGLATRK